VSAFTACFPEHVSSGVVFDLTGLWVEGQAAISARSGSQGVAFEPPRDRRLKTVCARWYWLWWKL